MLGLESFESEFTSDFVNFLKLFANILKADDAAEGELGLSPLVLPTGLVELFDVAEDGVVVIADDGEVVEVDGGFN